ncbi:MAG: ABC transporter ATP-binding protein [Rhodospirillales bacterium]|nr:ABC transporter ATP-binding protein [Rhodospirillales bacterium]
MAEPVIELNCVGKKFDGRPVVDGFDLSVPNGARLGLLGPNGAGKTTLLRMIYGVTRPDAGSVRVFGTDITRDPRPVRARLGVTLQDNVLIDALSPRENLTVFGRYHLLGGAALSNRVNELIHFLDLESHADLAVEKLSGGFKRRLAVALSLMNSPELLILDEPTTGLDPAVRHALWSRIRKLGGAGTTVLITTHYMDEAQRLCDSVVIMDGGKAIARGVPEDLITRHLAPQAVELGCTEAEGEQLLDRLGGGLRSLRAGSRLMIFADDGAGVVEAIHTLDGGGERPHITRPANLEDVFLLLTGTSLEGGA